MPRWLWRIADRRGVAAQAVFARTVTQTIPQENETHYRHAGRAVRYTASPSLRFRYLMFLRSERRQVRRFFQG